MWVRKLCVDPDVCAGTLMQACIFCLSCTHKEPCLHGELEHSVRRAVSRARLTHFKERHCHTVMWQTAASATDISTHWDWIFPLRWGGTVAWEGTRMARVVGSQTCCCANINHVDSYGINRADHFQSLHSSSVLTKGSEKANFYHSQHTRGFVQLPLWGLYSDSFVRNNWKHPALMVRWRWESFLLTFLPIIFHLI